LSHAIPATCQVSCNPDSSNKSLSDFRQFERTFHSRNICIPCSTSLCNRAPPGMREVSPPGRRLYNHPGFRQLACIHRKNRSCNHPHGSSLPVLLCKMKRRAYIAEARLRCTTAGREEFCQFAWRSPLHCPVSESSMESMGAGTVGIIAFYRCIGYT